MSNTVAAVIVGFVVMAAVFASGGPLWAGVGFMAVSAVVVIWVGEP